MTFFLFFLFIDSSPYGRVSVPTLLPRNAHQKRKKWPSPEVLRGLPRKGKKKRRSLLSGAARCTRDTQSTDYHWETHPHTHTGRHIDPAKRKKPTKTSISHGCSTNAASFSCGAAFTIPALPEAFRAAVFSLCAKTRAPWSRYRADINCLFSPTLYFHVSKKKNAFFSRASLRTFRAGTPLT